MILMLLQLIYKCMGPNIKLCDVKNAQLYTVYTKFKHHLQISFSFHIIAHLLVHTYARFILLEVIRITSTVSEIKTVF